MAKICLSPDSVMGRLAFGREEITREDSCEISAVKGLMKTQDPNLLIIFEEGDREELSSLDDRMVLEVSRILQLEGASASDIVDHLLPKPKTSIPKSAKRGAKKAAKKVKELILPETEIVTEEVEEPTEIVDSE